jgi:hypothetical protein
MQPLQQLLGAAAGSGEHQLPLLIALLVQMLTQPLSTTAAAPAAVTARALQTNDVTLLLPDFAERMKTRGWWVMDQHVSCSVIGLRHAARIMLAGLTSIARLPLSALGAGRRSRGQGPGVENAGNHLQLLYCGYKLWLLWLQSQGKWAVVYGASVFLEACMYSITNLNVVQYMPVAGQSVEHAACFCRDLSQTIQKCLLACGCSPCELAPSVCCTRCSST